MGKIYADNCKIMRDTNTELRGYEIDLCDNLMIYLSMGFGKKVQHFLRDFFKNQYDEKLRKAVTVNGAAEAYTVWMDKFSQIILLLMGCVGISMKFMTISEVIEIMVIFPTLEVIIKQMETCIKNRHNLKELLERMKFFYCREGQELHDVPEGEIEVEDLVFGYQEELVLRNVNFTLSKNKNVIYGKNGSGKSTLLKLLCGFLTNYQGKIKIGSMDLRGNEESWFQKYAYVSQNTMIFEGTLEENIAMSEKFDDVRMKKIIRETDLNHLLGRIVKKEDVSGGERQRISIARALYSEREWLLLDEPDKHLDSDTLQWLENFIKETDRKLVYVTHSDELKEYADKCIAL